MQKNKTNLLCSIIIFLVHTFSASTQELSLLQMQNEAHSLLREGIMDGDVSKIYNSLDLLHRTLEINPNYFEVLRDITIAHFSLGDLQNTKKYNNLTLIRNPEDIHLRLLDIFIEITENNLIVAKDKLNILKLDFPFSIEVNYIEIIYASAINDMVLLDNLIFQLRKKYGNDNLYSYILSLVKAIDNSTESELSNKDEKLLRKEYGENPWIKWLLATYFLKLDQFETSQNLLISLEDSGLIALEHFAFEHRIFIEFKKSNFKTMANIAREYTQKYPKLEKSWEMLGLSYFYNNDYKLAERAFARALELNEHSFLLDFMYDSILKKGGNDLKEVRNKHTDALESEIKRNLDTGNVGEAEDLAEHALYVDSLLIYPREVLAKLYALEGNYYRAYLELKSIIDRGFGNSVMDQLYKDYYDKTLLDVENMTSIAEVSHLDDKDWIIELIIKHEHSENDLSEMYVPFINDVFLKREFSLSKYIEWVTEDYNDISNVRYSFEITFSEKKDNNLVNVKLRDRFTKATLYSLDKIYTYQDSLYQMAHDLKDIIEEMVPKFGDVLHYDKISSEIVLDITHAGELNIGESYKLYPNKKTYPLLISNKEDHFEESVAPLGTIEIIDLTSHFSLAKLLKSDDVFKDEYLRFVRNIHEGDFIVVPPKPWEELSQNEDIISILKNSKSESDFSFYLKNLFLSELFFSFE